jgi:hypothetical protein
MKTPKPTIPQVEAFERRALANLPDSLEQRTADLEVLVSILPRATFGYVAAVAMLDGLRASQQAQKEFVFGGAK